MPFTLEAKLVCPNVRITLQRVDALYRIYAEAGEGLVHRTHGGILLSPLSETKNTEEEELTPNEPKKSAKPNETGAQPPTEQLDEVTNFATGHHTS
jgi:hypothetical protein